MTLLDAQTNNHCETTARYRRAGEAHDIDGLLATLAPNAVFRSPITNRVAFRGQEEIRPLLAAVFSTLRNTQFFADLGDDRTRALFHRAEVGGQPIEEVSRVVLGDDGLIEEITLYVRPLPGLATMAACLAPKVAAPGSRRPSSISAGRSPAGLTRCGSGRMSAAGVSSDRQVVSADTPDIATGDFQAAAGGLPVVPRRTTTRRGDFGWPTSCTQDSRSWAWTTLYPGSWSEWIADPGRPVARGGTRAHCLSRFRAS